MEVSLCVVNVFRDSPEKAAGVPSGVFAKKAHFVEPPIRFRTALMYFPRPTTADRGW